MRDNQVSGLREANADAKEKLGAAARTLRGILADEQMIVETPLEVEAAMRSALELVDAAFRRLQTGKPRATNANELSSS